MREMKPAHIPPSISYVNVARKIKLSPFVFTLFIFLLPFAYIYKEDLTHLVGQFGGIIAQQPETPGPSEKKERLPFVINKLNDGNSCNLFSGKWVRDNITRPLYQEADCAVYMKPQMQCLQRGRPEKEYQFWRWQPFDCDLPSFNATMMLEALRGKRMLFVGDSLNLGQFTSMVCLLQSVIPKHAKSFNVDGSFRVFTAMDYNATVEFYWAPLLLESNKDHPTKHNIQGRIVRNGSINTHGDHWKGRDIIVFSTYIWWTGKNKINILEGSFQDEKLMKVVKVPIEDAYSLAINGMLAWVKKNMDLTKTRIFFTSMSPTHEKSEHWGAKPGGSCYNETRMIEDLVYWDSNSRKTIMRVITDILQEFHDEVPVTFLNITHLSLYRKDAHTSIYKKHYGLTPEKLANPVSYADCLHWCLPGLHDTWNELLFANLFYE